VIDYPVGSIRTATAAGCSEAVRVDFANTSARLHTTALSNECHPDDPNVIRGGDAGKRSQQFIPQKIYRRLREEARGADDDALS
jgi:hypothetical protein